MKWLKEHLNKIAIIVIIVLSVLNFIGGFLAFVPVYFGFLNEAIILLAAFIVNLIVLILVIKDRGDNFMSLFWVIIPSALVTLFAFIGFEILKALDRAHPSF